MSFQPRISIEQVEEGLELAPKFGPDGLMPCITTDAASGEVLWHKGGTSGLVQHVVELRIDDDQDALWLRVQLQAGPQAEPASCHVGYRSCFYRAVDPDTGALRFVEDGKTFDPRAVYGDAPNPTVL
jgi:phosphoribosyl-AMP cyclohydrolase